MILILCLDDADGFFFGGKRQSRDRMLCNNVLELVGNAPLHLTPYSQMLFEGAPRLCVSVSPEKKAGKGEFYFAEDGVLPKEGVEKICLYRWNRRYPADRRFDLKEYETKLCERTEFAGSSHERITREIYEVMQ